jgi:DNA-binding transcriptional LysR family regulator
MEEPLIVALNAQHPLASRTQFDLSDLAHDDFVLFPKDVAPGLHAQVFAVCREAGFTPRVTQESRELYTTVSLVEAGMGVTIAPASVQKMGWSGVVFRPIASPLAQSHIEMAWRADDRRAVVRAFVRLVRSIRRP